VILNWSANPLTNWQGAVNMPVSISVFKNGNVYILEINPNSDLSPDASTILAADLVGYS
jgi:hypothetical protein